MLTLIQFLSTLSLRRATLEILLHCLAICNFYPRSPCGERLVGDVWACRWPDISIHALLAESDRKINTRGSKKVISIHALLAESDYLATRQSHYVCYFYPRSPCGERHSANANLRRHSDFYPRSPCGERRGPQKTIIPSGSFLSTLSLRRATVCRVKICIDNADFYPRSPCGERQLKHP